MKVWSKSDNRFKSYELSKFKDLNYGGTWVGNSAHICDVIEENSPLVLYTEFHIFFFFYMKSEIRNHHSFRNACAQILFSHHIFKQQVRRMFTFPEKLKKVKFCVQNQWRVLLNDITELGRVANSRIPILWIYLNFGNS